MGPSQLMGVCQPWGEDWCKVADELRTHLLLGTRKCSSQLIFPGILLVPSPAPALSSCVTPRWSPHHSHNSTSSSQGHSEFKTLT